ncbi:DUF6325 family protein [Nocardioides caricicola]|uniref:DUF6325 family protein n=1 Tax=Nocardioides caricicola TaxID=634770 RepID=A0ABW0N7D7_9ACTN
MVDDEGELRRAVDLPDLDLVEYVVITLGGLSATASIAGALKELVEAARIRILDLVAVVTDAEGHYTSIEAESVPGLAALRGVEGEVGGLLSEDDIALACGALKPSTTALILVVEDRWAHLLADAARQGGGRIVGGERIPRHRIAQSLRAAGRRSVDTT